MSDIFREIEDEVRQERLQKWWKKYGDYVIAGVSVVVIAVAGWKLWQHYEQQQRLKASSKFESAVQMSAAGQSDLAAQAFAQIAKQAPSGYAKVAEMSRADDLLAAGRTNEAVAIYMKLADSNKNGLGDVARMRAAWAQADTISAGDLNKLLAPLNDGKSQWRFMAQELIAYKAFKDGNIADALKQYRALAAEPGVIASVRARAEAMATFLATSGGANYGTVPPPEKPVPNAQTPAQQGTPQP